MFNNVKIALGYEIRNGPWGGGNKFLKSFKSYFEAKGAKITDKLEENTDIIFLFNPRRKIGTFDYRDAKRYKRRFPETKIIFRINDNDRTGRNYKGDRLRLKTCKISDGVVFISEWLCDYFIEKGFDTKTCHAVIRNGSDKNIFNTDGYIPWRKGEPMKIVTHHWSDNCMKGADVYQHFDELLEDPWMRSHFEFTYIGRIPRVPSEIHFKHTHCIPPLDGIELARELKKHHVYLTASQWEACGMHQLEGACCGLPVLFRDEGGGIVETCQGYGIQFSKSTFVISLFKMLEKYHQFQPKMNDFPFTAKEMNNEYEKFILNVLNRKE